MTGTNCESIASLPFGDGQSITGTCGDVSPMHFTGKERDSESGLDNFGARYNSSSLGRFMSPDAALVDQYIDNPQSWNLYTYVRNNPLINIDPNGECTRDSQGNFHGDDCGQGTGTGDKPDQIRVTPPPPRVDFWAWHQRAQTESEKRFHSWNRANGVTEVRAELPLLFGPVDGLGPADAELGYMAKLSGILQEAAAGKGNFGLGEANAAEAAELGEAWVGSGATTATDGVTRVSANGLRVYRPPSFKPSLGKVQANFEQKLERGGQPVSNGHLDIK